MRSYALWMTASQLYFYASENRLDRVGSRPLVRQRRLWLLITLHNSGSPGTELSSSGKSRPANLEEIQATAYSCTSRIASEILLCSTQPSTASPRPVTGSDSGCATCLTVLESPLDG